MARRGNGTAEPFRQMIDRANPNVAVTGTFFSLDDLQPVGDIVIDGSLVHFGGMGTALCITPDNHADMVTVRLGPAPRLESRTTSSSPAARACCSRGRVVLDPRSERFRDKHMLSPNSRIAVGITRGNTLFFAMTHEPIYLGRLARVMQSLGASEAMNLDAGTSTGFYYNGATLAKPGRQADQHDRRLWPPRPLRARPGPACSGGLPPHGHPLPPPGLESRRAVWPAQ